MIARMIIQGFSARNYNCSNIKKVLPLFLILNNILVFAQEDFREGFIIDKKYDTIKGLIDYNASKYYICRFKPGVSDKVTDYKPFDIYSYRFKDDKYYISKTVTLQKDYIKNEVLDRDYDSPNFGHIIKFWYDKPGTKTENVFLEYLISGKISIFYFKDERNVDHFFAEKDTLIDLTEEIIKVYDNGGLYSENKGVNYRGKLLALMRDDSLLIDQIKKTELTHKDLISISKNYHYDVCKSDSCIIYERKIKPVQYKFLFRSGVGYSATKKLEIYNGISLTTPTFTDKNYFFLNLNLHVLNYLQNMEKTSFIFGIELFSNNYYSNSYSIDRLSGPDTTVRMTYHSYNVCLNQSVLQRLSSNAKSLFFEIGMSELYSFNESFKSYEDYFNYNYVVDSYNKLQIGVILAFGYELPVMKNKNHISFELQYKQFLDQKNINFNIGYEF
jgi:hypothetical protein